MHRGSSGTRKQDIIYFRWDFINITMQSVHYLILWIKIICIKDIFAIQNSTKTFLVLLITAATGIIENIFLVTLHCFLMLLFLNFLSNSNPIHFVIDMVKRDNNLQSEVRKDFSNGLCAHIALKIGELLSVCSALYWSSQGNCRNSFSYSMFLEI